MGVQAARDDLHLRVLDHHLLQLHLPDSRLPLLVAVLVQGVWVLSGCRQVYNLEQDTSRYSATFFK